MSWFDGRRLRLRGRSLQWARFLGSGGAVAVLYIATTSALASLAGVPFQLALAFGFTVAVCAHFVLQRFFVWRTRNGYALPLRSQVRRYLVVAGVQYGLAAAVTATLPGFLGVSTTIVYLAWTALASMMTFVIFGGRVFHSGVTGGFNALSTRSDSIRAPR